MNRESWVLVADHRERGSRLAELARQDGKIDFRFQHLGTGDYVVRESIVLERKSYADFAVSILDGRLFQQAAALARSSMRSLVLVEGPEPATIPQVHPHSFLGAVLALSVAWRIPVVFSRDAEQSLLILHLLAHQTVDSLLLPRHGHKPKRVQTRKLYLLQGLPGIGPKMALKLLQRFGSVESVMRASAAELTGIDGIGPKKASFIRRVLE